MTKKQLIALFEAMESNSRAIAHDAEANGNQELYRLEKGQASALATVVSALRSPKFAKELAEIYEVDF